MRYGQCFGVEQFLLRTLAEQRTINNKLEQSVSRVNIKLQQSVLQLQRQVRKLQRTINTTLRNSTTTMVQGVKTTPPGNVSEIGRNHVPNVQDIFKGSKSINFLGYSCF